MNPCPSLPSFRVVASGLFMALLLLAALPANSAAGPHRSFDDLMALCSADPLQAKAAGSRWLADATTTGNSGEQIQALLVLVEASGRLEEPEDIARHADRGIELARSVGDDGAQARFLAARAYAGALLGEEDKGWPLQKRALELAESQDDLTARAVVFGSYGAAALWYGTIEDAQHYLTRSLEIFQEHGPPDRLAIALLKLNDLHNALGNADQALRDVEEASRVLPQGRYPYLESIVAYNLGVNHLRMEHFEQAREQFERALALSNRLDDQQGVAFARQRLAMIAIKQDAPRIAEQHALGALEVFDGTGNQLMRLLTRLTLADARTHADDPDALRTIEEARALVSGQDVDSQVRFHEQAGRTFARFGEHAQAYEHMLAAYMKGSELARKQNSDRVHEQQARFDTERKEMENELLRRERSLQQARLAHTASESQRRGLILALLLLLVGIVGYALWVQIRHRRKLATLALRDELTGAPNRRNIMLYAKQQLAAAGRDRSVCLAIADIDYFKKVNDTYGHAVGDHVLQAFVSACTPQLRGGDRLGRIGGEEFLFVLPGAAPANLPDVFQRLQAALGSASIGGLPPGYPLAFSLGAVFAGGDSRPGHDLDALLEHADAALYQAKHDGRNCLRVAGDDPSPDGNAPIGSTQAATTGGGMD